MTDAVLDDQALNRATLARQLLLDRSPTPVLDAVEHLVGLQAQEPPDPYLALWSRLAGFRPEDLAQLLMDRKVVRIAVMRGTVHLVTADDCLLLRPLMQPVLSAEIRRHRDHAPWLVDVGIEPVMAFVRELVHENPLPGRQMRAALAERFPELDAAALAYAARCYLPMVQVPPRGVWRRSAQVATTTAESWLGRPLMEGAVADVAGKPSIDEVVLRYFGAFGPATVADVAAWCRLTGLREVVERVRPRLRTFRDERGRELFDVPDGPRPAADVPAPVRFLPEYDNVLLSHADRTRFVFKQSEVERLYALGERGVGAVLHDGRLRTTWKLTRDRAAGTATLNVGYLSRLPDDVAEDIEAEGRRALTLLADDTAPAARRLAFIHLAAT